MIDIGKRLFLVLSMVLVLSATIALALCHVIPSEAVTAILTGLVFAIIHLLEAQTKGNGDANGQSANRRNAASSATETQAVNRLSHTSLPDSNETGTSAESDNSERARSEKYWGP